MRDSRAAVIACALSTLAACHLMRAPASTTATTGARVKPGRMILNDDAAMILAKARCQRKATCGDVGSTGHFATRDECLRGLFPQESLVVGADGCPAGVDEWQLSSCVADLRAEPCEQAVVGAGEPASCDRLALCTSPAEP